MRKGAAGVALGCSMSALGSDELASAARWGRVRQVRAVLLADVTSQKMTSLAKVVLRGTGMSTRLARVARVALGEGSKGVKPKP
jgi:hypothetical protein